MPPRPSPDPRLGLFETMLVLDGRPVELDAHLRRIAVSIEENFSLPLPAGCAEVAIERARPLRLGRLRMTISPGATGDLAAEVVARPIEEAIVFPAPAHAAALRSVRVAGGLGAHKWADRARLPRLKGGVALLLDEGDEVLEAARANVFVVFGETLATPSADGRILPGLARAGAIAAALEAGFEVREEALGTTDLFAADEVFLTGSVRGVEPACALDGAPLPAARTVSRRVAAGLRRRWLGGPAGAAPTPAAAPPPGQLAR